MKNPGSWRHEPGECYFTGTFSDLRLLGKTIHHSMGDHIDIARQVINGKSMGLAVQTGCLFWILTWCYGEFILVISRELFVAGIQVNFS